MPTFEHNDWRFEPVEFEFVEKPWYGDRTCWRIVIKNCDGTDHEAPQVFNSRESAEEKMPDALGFMVKFWGEQLDDRSNAVVCDGTHYRIGDEKKGGSTHSGFGGSRFTFTSLTGKVVTSTNVWYQGVIPAFARPSLPDTHTQGK